MLKTLSIRLARSLIIGFLGVLANVSATSLAAADAFDLAKAGFAAKERRDCLQAIGLFNEAIRQGNFDNERYGFLVYSRGVCYESMGIRDKALADFDTAIALLPRFPNSYIYRGLIWTFEREYDRAIDDFLRARLLSPKDPLIFNNLAGAYEKKGDLDRAIESYDEAVRLHPGYAEAYYNRGLTYIFLGNNKKGIADLSKAGELGIVSAYNIIKRFTEVPE